MFPPERYAYPNDAVLESWRRFGGRVLVAEIAGDRVGVAGVDGKWLHGFYVVPREWGRGVAPLLHDAAVAVIAEGHDEARLWCLEENHRARRFYERRGWRLNGETRVVSFPPSPLDVGYSLALAPSA